MITRKKAAIEDSLENMLRSIPAHLLTKTINEWTKKQLEFTDDMQGSDRTKLLKDNAISISNNKYKRLKKISFLTNLKEKNWKAFILDEGNFFVDKSMIEELKGSTFPIDAFIDEPKADVKGIFHSVEIKDNICLIVLEFSSRSPLYRMNYRYLFFPGESYILMESKKNAKELFETILAEKIGIKAIKHKKVNAVMCFKVGTKFIPSEISFLVSNEIAGTAGIDTITLHGDNVLRGVETLESRQEFDVGLTSLGPWCAISIENLLRLSIKNNIEILAIGDNLRTILDFSFSTK